MTGATGTLGGVLVAALLEAGCEVVAGFWQGSARAEALAQLGCTLFRGDLSDESTVETLFQTRFEAVLHLAAQNHDALLLRLSASSWCQQLRFGAQSAFLVTRASLQHLPWGGHLVLLGSRVGERGSGGQSAYAADKAAILGLMKTAALEGRARGICVNAICPGFAPSALSQDVSAAVLARREAENWLPGADAAQSFAALGVWLLETRISGQVLRPDCRI